MTPQDPSLFGIPVDFVLFGVPLAGVAVESAREISYQSAPSRD
jgi:hypothetical protein